MNYLEEISVLQEVCLALHSLGEGSLGARGSCTFCKSSWSTLLWKLAPHEVGWPQQGPREEEPTTLPKSH